MLYFRMVEVEVSSPWYVSFFLPYVTTDWILHFHSTHISLCTRASLHTCFVVRVPKQDAVRCTTSPSARLCPQEHVATIFGAVILCLGKANGRHGVGTFNMINQHLVSIALS